VLAFSGFDLAITDTITFRARTTDISTGRCANDSGTITPSFGAQNNCPATYVCGDANGNGSVDISDAVYLIAYIFSGVHAPCTP
jgi:hypothetical protein